LKSLALSAWVVSSEPRRQPLSTESTLPWAEEEPTVVAKVGASTTPPPPVSTAAVEEGEAAMEATATMVALEATTGVGPSSEDVVVLDEDSVPPPSLENHDVVMATASELAQVTVIAGPLPAVEVSEPSPVVGVSGLPLTAEAAETSSARVALTAEEVMELATC
jgi:hypothetical protein